MNRRDSVRELLGLGIAALPSLQIVRAKEVDKKARSIGVLSSASGPLPQPMLTDFEERLRELGWVEGQNLRIHWRYFGEAPRRVHEFVPELVRLQPDVIVAWGEGTARQVLYATQKIPIVALGGDLGRAGLVRSIARPEGNVTGVNTDSPALVPKRLQLLKEAVPKMKRVTMLLCPPDEFAVPRLQTVARSIGLTLSPVIVSNRQQVRAALDRLPASRADALLVLDCGVLHTRGLIETRLPASYYAQVHARTGALMSYGHRWRDTERMLADYVDKILKGSKPADLPVQQPTQYSLVVNLKTAKALGLTLPQSLLLRADEVIE